MGLLIATPVLWSSSSPLLYSPPPRHAHAHPVALCCCSSRVSHSPSLLPSRTDLRLVFLDGHTTSYQTLSEDFSALESQADIILLSGILSDVSALRGRKLFDELGGSPRYLCLRFVATYPSASSFSGAGVSRAGQGVGLCVRRAHVPPDLLAQYFQSNDTQSQGMWVWGSRGRANDVSMCVCEEGEAGCHRWPHPRTPLVLVVRLAVVVDPRVANNLALLNETISTLAQLYNSNGLTNETLQGLILRAGLFPYMGWQVGASWRIIGWCGGWIGDHVPSSFRDHSLHPPALTIGFPPTAECCTRVCVPPPR
jgi:hypothetical protein